MYEVPQIWRGREAGYNYTTLAFAGRQNRARFRVRKSNHGGNSYGIVFRTQRVKILFLVVDPALQSRPGAYRLRGSFDSGSRGLLHLMRQVHSQLQLMKAPSPFPSRSEDIQPPFSDTGLGALLRGGLGGSPTRSLRTWASLVYWQKPS